MHVFTEMQRHPSIAFTNQQTKSGSRGAGEDGSSRFSTGIEGHTQHPVFQGV